MRIFYSLFLAVSLTTACLESNAFDIEIGTGETHYKTAHDGLWYQSQFQNELDLKTVPWSVGISKKIDNLRYRAQILSLGGVYTSGVWASDDDHYPGSKATAVYIGKGKGSASGIVLSVSRDVNIFNLPLYAEAGAFFYVPSWTERISEYSTTKYLYDLTAEKTVRVGPVMGVGIRHSGIDISIKYIGMQYNGAEPFPPIWDRAYVLEAKIYF